MWIRRRRGWEIPESRVTPEHVVLKRRSLVGAGMAGLVLTGAVRSASAWGIFSSDDGDAAAKPADLKPLTAAKNDRYKPGRALTDAKDVASYNNYYEFGMSKNVISAAAKLKTDPWSIEIAGMVKQPRSVAFEDLMKSAKLEERIYRHRCVEAWAMTVPWTGFPMADLVKLAEPLGSAKYVKFTTLHDDETMPGLRQAWYPWPYVEGVTMQEAMNELSFLTVGMYGKSVPPQNGAPIRVTLPWKYGFKSIKSIVKVEFTDQRPVSFWEQLQDAEYGFWANVNPEVPHPRWSQEQERLLGTNEVVPTQIWNGYGEFVAAMYEDKKSERLFA